MSRPTKLRRPHPPERARPLASSCRGSAPATKTISLGFAYRDKAASDGGLIIASKIICHGDIRMTNRQFTRAPRCSIVNCAVPGVSILFPRLVILSAGGAGVAPPALRMTNEIRFALANGEERT